jgi:hypothetical protein
MSNESSGNFVKIAVSSTNKIDHHDITEILLKVALKYHKPTITVVFFSWVLSLFTSMIIYNS